MATISQIKTKKVFFSIRWKILIAFLLILGVSFYGIATFLINLVGDYLFETRISAESAQAQAMAVEFADLFAHGEADALYAAARVKGGELRGRVLLIDMDGKVQVDTSCILNGVRVGHPEVKSVLGGAPSDYGFHLLNDSENTQEYDRRALFDFLRNLQTGKIWAGYFAAAIQYENTPIGLVLYSVSVQDVVTTLRVMSDRMLLYFFAAALVVLITSMFFSRVITRPIAVLTEGIKRMSRGDLSSRVKVSGVDEMARLAETFNQMSEKLENLDTSRNEFVSNASHELKTPLATMKILLESMLYQDDMDPELRKEFMTDINKELDRLSQIVSDLLTLVQTDSRDYKLVKADILLRDLAKDTVRRLQPLAEENQQKLELRGQADGPLFADPTKLQQAIYNLVDNAIKYSPKGGQIRVTVKQEGKMAILEVKDTGPGIPKKDQAHIFERFYRVDKARARATGGNGLGLSIVHQIVLLHGGSVSVHSEEGKGSMFRIELPMQ